MRKPDSHTDQTQQNTPASGISAEATLLKLIATESGVSTRTLQRRYQGRGTKFIERRNATRHSIAKQMLQNEKLAILEVALALGYADSSSFCRAFRRWAGVTPSAYRESLRATAKNVSCHDDDQPGCRLCAAG